MNPMTKPIDNNIQFIIKIMKSLRTIPITLCMAMIMLLLASCGKTVKCESVDIVPRPLSVEMQDGTYKMLYETQQQAANDGSGDSIFYKQHPRALELERAAKKKWQH